MSKNVLPGASAPGELSRPSKSGRQTAVGPSASADHSGKISHPSENVLPRRTTCLHCGLNVPARRFDQEDDFCCLGCARVYALIRDAGLDRYYDLRQGPTAPPSEARPDSFAWAERLLQERGPDNGQPFRFTLQLQGIHCAACVWLLQELFRRDPGGLQLRINSSLGEADFAILPERFDLVGFLQTAHRFGYRFGEVGTPRVSTSRGLLVRLGLCVALTMNLMILSLSFYFGLAPEDGTLYVLFGRLSAALGTLIFLVGGTLFLQRAFEGLRRGVVHLDLPIAVGIVLVYATSLITFFTQGPEATYFDTLATFVTLMVLGRWLQERLVEKNRNSVLGDGEIQGLTSRRIRDGQVEFIPCSTIREGDELWIVPGEIVPVQCWLLGDASAQLALDWMTGESSPEPFVPGALLPAGAINAGNTTLRVCAHEPFAASRLVALLQRRNDEDRSAAQSFLRRLSPIYVVVVGVLAVAGFLVWLPHGAHHALAVAASILVVTCPCAIGIATPLAHDLTLGNLRRRGIFVRREDFFERALGIRKILFDKTGTLTWGSVKLTPHSRNSLADLEPHDRDALAAMAIRSNHPVSRALVECLPSVGPANFLEEDGDSIREVPGEGLEWRREGTVFRLGKRRFAAPVTLVKRVDIGQRTSGEDESRGVVSTAEEATTFARDGRILAHFEIEETFRPDAPQEIDALRGEGYDVHLVSGDSASKVKRVAETLHFPESHVKSEATPEEKASFVRAIDANDTLFVGDGLNDALSFEASTCSATPAVDRPSLPSRVDFFFLGEGIAAVRTSIHAARRLAEITRTNFAVSIAYNAITLALCFSGKMTPVLAAILMPASSLGIVAWTTTRLRRRGTSWK